LTRLALHGAMEWLMMLLSQKKKGSKCYLNNVSDYNKIRGSIKKERGSSNATGTKQAEPYDAAAFIKQSKWNSQLK
jgi:hypothetical protein